MKMFISKYALSGGIIESEVEPANGLTGWMKCHWDNNMAYCHKKYCHENRASAVASAEEMRQKKLIQLENQIQKLKSIKF